MSHTDLNTLKEQLSKSFVYNDMTPADLYLLFTVNGKSVFTNKNLKNIFLVLVWYCSTLKYNLYLNVCHLVFCVLVLIFEIFITFFVHFGL